METKKQIEEVKPLKVKKYFSKTYKTANLGEKKVYFSTPVVLTDAEVKAFKNSDIELETVEERAKVLFSDPGKQKQFIEKLA